MIDCSLCEQDGTEYCGRVCGNPCYGCSDYDDMLNKCMSNGACGSMQKGATV